MSSQPPQFLTHRIRFFYYEPKSINCIDYNEKLGKLALLRRSIRKHKPTKNDMPSTIEIWNLQHKAWYLEQTIYEDPLQSNLLESIAWSKCGRLFSCGLNTYLNEYDLKNGRISRSYCVNSDPTWCMAIDSDNELIACGTEKGFICTFKMYDECLQFEKIMPKNENRILCLQWHHKDSDTSNLFLIAGSIDFVKIYNYQKNSCVDFIRIGNNRIICWCLRVLKDFTIITGDSNGTVSFWNGKTVTLIQSYHSHRGDVLALANNDEEDIVFATGVDPTIVQFHRCYGPLSSTWAHSSKQRPHNHDIRSMIYKTNHLIIGGIDTRLTTIGLKSNNQISYLPNLHQKCSFASNQISNYIGFMYEKFIQIWRLGYAEPVNRNDDDEEDNKANKYKQPGAIKRLKMMEKATKLLDINSRTQIIAFDMNSEWIIYANYQTFKAIKWNGEGIEKIKILHDPISNISNIHILYQANKFVISYGSNFIIFKLDIFGIVHEYSGESLEQKRIVRILSTKNIMILILENNSVEIYNLENINDNNYESLSRPLTINFEHQPCATIIDHKHMKLWLSFPNSMLIEYDLQPHQQCRTFSLNKLRSTNETKECRKFHGHWIVKQMAIVSENSLLLSDDNNLYMLNLTKNNMIKCDKYHHIISMINIPETIKSNDINDNDNNNNNVDHNENDDERKLTNDNLVIVEMTNQMIMSTLPPSLMMKTYGVL